MSLVSDDYSVCKYKEKLVILQSIGDYSYKK